MTEAGTFADWPLSAREAQAMDTAILGLTNAEVAERLTVTSHAIKLYLSSAYRKLGVANATQAAVAYLALERGGGS
jgi:DNA-binding NarL/FixJ family response regulator